MNNITNLQDAIKAILLDRTLSVETLDAVKEIQEQNVKLEETNKTLLRSLTTADELAHSQASRLAVYSTNEKTLAGRIAAVVERETKITELEKAAAVAQAESKVFNLCFDKVFRNVAVHKSTTSNIPVGVNGAGQSPGYVSSHPASSIETETIS